MKCLNYHTNARTCSFPLYPDHSSKWTKWVIFYYLSIFFLHSLLSPDGPQKPTLTVEYHALPFGAILGRELVATCTACVGDMGNITWDLVDLNNVSVPLTSHNDLVEDLTISRGKVCTGISNNYSYSTHDIVFGNCGGCCSFYFVYALLWGEGGSSVDRVRDFW